MDIHDAHSVTLLIIRRRAEKAEIEATDQCDGADKQEERRRASDEFFETANGEEFMQHLWLRGCARFSWRDIMPYQRVR